MRKGMRIIVVVKNLLQEQGERSRGMRRDPYMMNVDRGRNYYSCRELSYLMRNCRNQSIVG